MFGDDEQANEEIRFEHHIQRQHDGGNVAELDVSPELTIFRVFDVMWSIPVSAIHDHDEQRDQW